MLSASEKDQVNNMCPVANAVKLGDQVGNQMPLQANSTAVDVAGVVADLNALLAKLKTAGFMANA